MSRIGNEVLRMEEEGKIVYDNSRSIYVEMPEEKIEEVEVNYDRR